MKKILGLDLGTNSIGWALVKEAQNENEKSDIIKLGVRVNPLTADEQKNFEEGKSITTNADRTNKRSARRNLQRFKLRRENLIEVLNENNFLNDNAIISEQGNNSTFQTYKSRAKAAIEQIPLEDFAKVLLMINKKRGYKSSRKAKSQEEGLAIDGMSVAMRLYENNLTPGQYVFNTLSEGIKIIPDFYRSDLQSEFDKIWEFQKQFYPEILTDDFQKQIKDKGKVITTKSFLAKYGIFTAENKEKDKRLQSYKWRVDAILRQLSKEELAFVISDVNGLITNSSGYLGAISDRSKELYFTKKTIGQYLIEKLSENSNYSLKNQVFYRQDYLDEFEKIWEVQSRYYKELTPELKHEIRDIVIFYQRRLKSQKGLISFCELESRKVDVVVDGKIKKKTIGLKVCPKSSFLFQEFKIWQILNNLEIKEKSTSEKRFLEQEEKEILFTELTYKEKLTQDKALDLISKSSKSYELNYKEIEGNRTQASLYKAYQQIIESTGHGEYDFAKMKADKINEIVISVFKTLNYNTDILYFNSSLDGKDFEKQPSFRFWHLLYSFEGDDSKTGNESLINKIIELYGFEREYAHVLANVSFQPDYGSLSSKAIRKILPFLRQGNEYSLACEYAGYRHSKNSLNKEELDNKVLKDKIDILPKNSLRNPVVEKILNQMINVVNTAIAEYGKPDEIRIELARELKNSAKERENQTKSIRNSTTEHEKIRDLLAKEFGFTNISRNDIIRYKLYTELEFRGYKTLYSNTYIPREKIFSKEFDIEHIIPQSRLFDDSFSNKTLELRSINIEKGNKTAYDYVFEKYGENGLTEYVSRINFLDNDKSKGKFKKLMMKEADIPVGFINRDLRDTQYIAKKAKEILESIVRDVVSTTGKITDRLREDWQLIDVMKELNWDKYNALGMTEIIENKDGRKIGRIIDWSKRNDHRHHAMDALTIAFTKRSYIQYLNNLNARSDKSGSIYGIMQKELIRNGNDKLIFKPPMPLNDFRAEAKKHLENILVSIKAKNKVVTQNINITKTKNGTKSKIQLTPRGQLHQETVYGSIKRYTTDLVKVGSSFDEIMISKVAIKSHRNALTKRLKHFDNDPKLAFTGKNSLDKNPIFLDNLQSVKLPEKVKIVGFENVYTIRKEVNPELNIDKVIDANIKMILQQRLKEFNDDPKKAFSNLNENPIWLNKDKGIDIKRVKISGITNALSLHDKKNKDGNLVLDDNVNNQPVDFISTGNNHHVAIYKDKDGNLQENVISFFEATTRVNQGLSVIDKNYNHSEGWEFLFSMKQNEYFIFPNDKTGFNPSEIDLLNPENYALISPNLFRVQKMATKDYFFRHHLETNVENNNLLKDLIWKRIGVNKLNNIIKVRINHIGQIVSIGEY